MDEILKKLQAVSNDLDTLKWEEELKKEQSDKINKNINDLDKEIKAEINKGQFTLESLDEVVKVLEDANSKVEAGLNSVNVITESVDSQKGKIDIQQAIKSKYEELFKQKEVIDQYIEKYDSKNIIGIKNAEIEKNNGEIENSKKLNNKIANFINTPEVSNAVNQIKEMKKKNEQLEKAEDAVKEIKKLEAKAKTPNLETLKEKYKEAITAKKVKLKDLLKDTEITYNDDMSVVENNIGNEKKKNNKTKEDSATQIGKALGKTGDTDLKKAFGDLTGKTPEQIVEALENGPIKVMGQIAKLNHENTRLQGAIDQMNKDMAVEDTDSNNISSYYSPVSYVPSDDEIENDPDYQAQKDSILVPAERKDKIAARQEYLRSKAGIEKDDEGTHPIIWFKSHFGTKKLDDEMVASNKSQLKEKIKEKLIQAKQKEEQETKVEAQTRKDKFFNQYKVTVVNKVLSGEKEEDVILGSAYKNAADEIDRD